jgi:hypothetical protein
MVHDAQGVPLFLAVILSSHPLEAQSPANPLFVSVVPGRSGASSWSPPQRAVLRRLVKGCQESGRLLSERPQEWVVLADALESGDSVAVSIQVGYAAPEDVVRLCRDAEVLSTNLPAEKRAQLPPEGTWVRAMVSEEFVRLFMIPLEGVLKVVTAKDLEAALRL